MFRSDNGRSMKGHTVTVLVVVIVPFFFEKKQSEFFLFLFFLFLLFLFFMDTVRTETGFILPPARDLIRSSGEEQDKMVIDGNFFFIKQKL